MDEFFGGGGDVRMVDILRELCAVRFGDGLGQSAIKVLSGSGTGWVKVLSKCCQVWGRVGSKCCQVWGKVGLRRGVRPGWLFWWDVGILRLGLPSLYNNIGGQSLMVQCILNGEHSFR